MHEGRNPGHDVRNARVRWGHRVCAPAVQDGLRGGGLAFDAQDGDVTALVRLPDRRHKGGESGKLGRKGLEMSGTQARKHASMQAQTRPVSEGRTKNTGSGLRGEEGGAPCDLVKRMVRIEKVGV